MRYWMTLGAFAVLALVMWCPEPARAMDTPPGSYLQTCRDVRVRGDRLFARCQTASNRWVDTSLDDVYRCSGDIQNPCKPPSNNTPSLSDAHVPSAQGLVIYLDAQEPGSDNSITLNSLTLNVYAATGTSDMALFSASYIGPPSPLDVCPGQGNNCVNAFVLNAIQAANLQTLLNNTTDSLSLRLGLAASFSNATGGPDRLFLVNTTDVPVPAPTIGHGLFVLLAVGGVFFGGKLLEKLKSIICTQRNRARSAAIRPGLCA